MDHLRKVQSGQKLEIPAATFNTFVDAAKDFQQRQRNVSQNVPHTFRQAGVVLVRNSSGTDRTRGEILGASGPIVGPAANLNEFKRQVAVDGDTPSPSQHLARFVVLTEPVASGKIGRAVVSGVAPAYVYVYEECHEWADVHPAPSGDEAYRLTSAQYGGAQILWKESGVGYKWAVVRLFGPELIQRIELATDLAPGGTAIAYPLKPDGAPDTNPDRLLLAYELLNKHSGWGRSEGYYRGARGYVKGCLDSNRWEVLNLEQFAHSITFTLSEDMGATSTGEATVTVDDYYRGTDPTMIFDYVKVHDPQDLFPLALSGAKGKATFDDRSKEYHITECQQMATLLYCTAASTVGPTDDVAISSSSIKIMQPIGGLSPVDGNATHDPTVTDVNNTFGDQIASGDAMIIGWNHEDAQWEIVELVRSGAVRWAKAQSDWQEADATHPHPYVSCRHCNRDGTGVDSGETEFDVDLPRTTDDFDPSAYTDSVLAYEVDSAGNKICVTNYGGSKIGDVKTQNHTTVPTGWRICDGSATVDLVGRSPVGLDSSQSDEDAIGKHVGYRRHGDDGMTEENNHAGHDLELDVDQMTAGSATNVSGLSVTGGGSQSGASIELTHSDTDNRGPRCVVYFIERFK